MQMHQTLNHLLAQLQRILRGQQAIVDHVADIGPFHVLKHQKGDVPPWNHIGIQHTHHMGVLGDVHQVAVLLLQALQGRVPVTDDELHRARHVAQGVDHLVDHTEAAAPELLLHDELVGQAMACRQVQVVGLGIIDFEDLRLWCFSWLIGHLRNGL